MMFNISGIIVFTFIWFMVFFFYGSYGTNINENLNTIIGNINNNLFCSIDPVLLTLIIIFIFVAIVKGILKFKGGAM